VIFQCLRSNAPTSARFRRTPRTFVALALTDPQSGISQHIKEITLHSRQKALVDLTVGAQI
jgi:hypothetical protein